MSRSKKKAIRVAHEKVNTNRAFKNDALNSVIARSMAFGSKDTRLSSEVDIFKSSKKALYRLKKYNGPTGAMSVENYMEFMGS